MMARAAKEPAAIRLAFLDDGGDFVERVSKNLLEQIDRTLRRRERLQDHEKRNGEGFGLFGIFPRVRRVIIRDDRLRKPNSNLLFPLRPRRFEMVDAETRDNRGEPRLGRLDFARLNFLPAEKRLLHHVFRIRRAAEHPVGDAKKELAVLLEDSIPWFAIGRFNL